MESPRSRTESANAVDAPSTTNNADVIVSTRVVDGEHSGELEPLVPLTNGAAASNTAHSGSGGGGGAARNYQTLSSNELFEAMESDPTLSTNPQWVASILNKRKNKKEDFTAALRSLLGGYHFVARIDARNGEVIQRKVCDNSAIQADRTIGPIVLELQKALDGTKWLNSRELTLLTEFAFRLKIATTNNNVHNQGRLDTLVEDLNGRSSTARKIAWLAFGLFVLTVAASLTIGAAMTWTIPVVSFFLKSMLPKVFYGMVAGVSGLQVLSFWSGYSRKSASNMLADVSVAAEEFFAQQPRLQATNPNDVVAMVAARSSVHEEETPSAAPSIAMSMNAATASA